MTRFSCRPNQFPEFLVVILIASSVNLCNGGRDYRQYFVSSQTPIDKNHPWLSIAKILTRTNFNPGSTKTTPQMIEYYGYPCETHTVITEDGYILTLHRIPHGRNDYGARRNGGGIRPVVFLQHGLFQSSYEWFMNKPENLLALKLANAGYDVWLGNSRGTTYSRKHVRLTTKDRAYWQFSMHEMGKYDLPAEIDYVISVTQQPRIFYIGSSMGNSQLWIMMSMRPEYNEKIRLHVAFAPVAFEQNIIGIPKFIAPFVRILAPFGNLFLRGEFLPPWILLPYYAIFSALCSNLYIAETVCLNGIFLQAGWSLPQQTMNQLPLFYSHSPAPVSVRTLAHIGQLINTGEFKEYDFGRSQNVVHYGQPCPPLYQLNRTTVPTALIYSDSTDTVVAAKDVKKLAGVLPNVIFVGAVNSSTWNHYDYHLGKDVNELVNEGVLRLMSFY